MPKGGPHGQEMYQDDWQPVIGLLWDELDRNYWKEVVVTGPVQASKSFGALVVPTLRDIVELGYSPILGVPEADMFADKWDIDFKPVLQSSEELRWLLPSKGSGAREGRVRDRVSFDNGTELKEMSRGGQSTNKAGYTTPRLRVTEAAGFSDASSSSRNEEADAYRQLLARLGAFDLMDPRRLAMIEGTGTVSDALPWRLRGEDDDNEDGKTPVSTQSRIVSRCPHKKCRAWISPEREHLVGWQDAKNILEAYQNARFLCPVCEKTITDAQRIASMQADCRLVHWGQEITPAGEIIGHEPAVLRLWFRWSTWHNCLINIGTVASEEWLAAQIEEGTPDRENAERDLCQKRWAIPYKNRLAEQEHLNSKMVMRKTHDLKRNILPHDTVKFGIGVDIGDYTGWWFGIAGREEGLLHCPTYGAFDIKRNKDDDLETRLKIALNELFDSFEEGFAQDGSDGLILPDMVWIDIGYLPDWVADVVRERGDFFGNKFRCVRGRGASVKNKSGGAGAAYQHPVSASSSIPVIGTQWHMRPNYDRLVPENTFNADFWKLRLASHLRISRGKKGSLTLFKAEGKNEHVKVAKHLTNEQFVRRWDSKKGAWVEEWAQTGDQHLNDSGAMALGALDEAGYQVFECEDPVVEITDSVDAQADDFYTKLLEGS